MIVIIYNRRGMNMKDELENTKEVNNLEDLRLEALNKIEDTLDKEISLLREDNNYDDYEEPLIEDETEEEEEPYVEEEKDVSSEDYHEEIKKENVFNKIKRNWQKLPKNKKILIVCISVVVLALLIGLICFFVFKKENTDITHENVILEKDNYRYENGKLVFLKDKKEIGTYECVNKDQNLCGLAVLSNFNIDQTKKVDTNNVEISLHSNIYNDKYVFVKDVKDMSDPVILLYNIIDSKVEEELYDTIVFDNYASVKDKDSKYGLISLDDNKTIIPFEYDELSILSDNLIKVRKDNNSYLADLNNSILTKAYNEDIRSASDKYVVTKDKNDKYHLYDYNGDKVVDKDFDYLTLIDDYYLAVLDKELYVYDYENNLYNIEGIKLINDNYNSVEVYDKNKLINTKKSFTYDKSFNTLGIKVYNNETVEKEKVIYLLEGKLSSKLAYYSYSDGKLYIFNDEAKTNLIGKYECNNKNTLEDENSTFSSCNIATGTSYRQTTGNNIVENKTTGMIPIFHKEYAFIKDGDIIVLYDLVNNKKLADYKSVDDNIYSGINELRFTNNDEQLICENTNNEFGIIKISSNKVEPYVEFKYQMIKRLNEYYVMKDNDGYALYSGSNKVSAYKKAEIVDYYKNYLKTMSDNLYYVHSFDEALASGNSYIYVELGDTVFAGVLNGRVHIISYDGHDYTSNTDSKLESKLKLNSKDFYNTDKVAFKFVEDTVNKRAIVSILNGDNYETIYVPLVKEEQELPNNNDSKPKEEVNTNTESGVTNGKTN